MSVKIRKFHAPWCGPCKALSPILEELAEGIEIESIDISDASPLELKNYGNIMGVPTVQILKDGVVINTMTGFSSKDKLQEFLKDAK